MFSRISRYWIVPDIAVPDAQGRVLPAKDIRLLPSVTGTFQHVVSQGDRLDQLAYTYYSQPLNWWHICDANPGILSPLALLDSEPVVTTQLTLADGDGSPPWADLLREVAALAGVERVEIVDDVQLVPESQQVNGQQVTVIVEVPVRAIQVTYNRLVTSPAAISGAISQAGLTPGPGVDMGQLGQQIVIPPAVTG
jgi:hypothetical protein